MLSLSKRSTWSALLLASAVVGASWMSCPTWADDAPPSTPPPATTPPATPEQLGGQIKAAQGQDTAPDSAKNLAAAADFFLHYSIVGRIDDAKAIGQKILDLNPDSKELLAAFESVQGERDTMAILQRDQREPDASDPDKQLKMDLKDVAKKLEDKLEEGHRDSARDPGRVQTEIERLDKSPTAYANAKDRLIAAGPFAVPFYISTLTDEKKKALHPYVIRLMGESGRSILPPLVEQLNTPVIQERIWLVRVIGEIGYPQAVPYLKALAGDANNTPELNDAITAAIAACDPKGLWSKMSTAEAFQALAQQYYLKDPTAAAPLPGEPENPVWFYDKGLDNVVGVKVPTAIWSSVETMRTTERALVAEPKKADAISLWIAADLRREILLPAGAKDPTMAEGTPDASFYAVAAGPVYLNPVLATAQAQHDGALMLRTIAALEATGGTSGLVSSKEGATPLVKALSYPDRAVRFSAAFALARANPAKGYPGSNRVVPLLIEAVSQTGTPSILLIEPNLENRNRIKGILSANYTVYDGGSLGAALETAHKAAAFDAVVVANGSEITQLHNIEATDYRLESAPVVVLGGEAGQPGVVTLKADADDKTVAETLAGLKSTIGQTPIDQTTAMSDAMTAIKLMSLLAVDHASIYNVNEAVPALTDTLKDKRPEVATGAASVLGQLNSAEAQKALADVSLAESTDTGIRTAYFTALAESAKRTGNALDADTIDRLIKIVGSKDLDPGVRNAAATALGALNVPSNQASTLILQQVR